MAGLRSSTQSPGRTARLDALRRKARVALGRFPSSPTTDSPTTNGHSPPPDDPGALLAWCMEREHVSRPHYLWSVLLAALTARGLQVAEISVLELGVAGGNGLLALEEAAVLTERVLGVQVEVWGFDSGTGMPEPRDRRDVPWAVRPGYFAMDEPALRGRLSRAQLALGPVETTVRAWAGAAHPPVGFVAFDLDYYSSTMDALCLFDAEDSALLPRVVCYFDDVLGYGWSEHNGERAAIANFNALHAQRKIGYVHGLGHFLPESERTRPWSEQIWMAHLFDHSRYCEFALELPKEFLDAHRLGPR
ncbi:MAG: hypothetical protein ACRDV4_06740 [Acidimicrobiales bacterium]